MRPTSKKISPFVHHKWNIPIPNTSLMRLMSSLRDSAEKQHCQAVVQCSAGGSTGECSHAGLMEAPLQPPFLLMPTLPPPTSLYSPRCKGYHHIQLLCSVQAVFPTGHCTRYTCNHALLWWEELNHCSVDYKETPWSRKWLWRASLLHRADGWARLRLKTFIINPSSN